MEDVVRGRAVMQQSLLTSPQQQYEAAVSETRQLLQQVRNLGALTAAAAGVAVLIAVVALLVAVLS